MSTLSPLREKRAEVLGARMDSTRIRAPSIRLGTARAVGGDTDRTKPNPMDFEREGDKESDKFTPRV